MVVKIFRSMHLYLALALIPWMLIYALSAITLNHREFFNKFITLGPQELVQEKETIYMGTIADDAGPRMMAEQILSDIGLDGSYWANENKNRGTVTIFRMDPLKPKRLTFYSADGKLVIEGQVVQTISFMRRMHFRRGYQNNFLMDDIWALTIDIAIFAIIFWGFSGLYMWWKRPSARLWGIVAISGGFVTFVVLMIGM